MALRVLLADESTTIKKVMQLALQDFSVDVKSVHSGVDVVDVAKTFKPDVIFIDILLPKRSGYKVAADLKADPNLRSIPVVLMWSSFMELDLKNFESSRANQKLEKPFEVETLRSLILELVPKTQGQRLAHFLKFPQSFVDPLEKEEADKRPPPELLTAIKQANDLGTTPPPIPKASPATPKTPPQAAITPPPLPKIPAADEQAPPSVSGRWNMDSFDALNNLSDEVLKPSNPSPDDTQESIQLTSLKDVAKKSVTPPPAVTPPPIPSKSSKAEDDEMWAHQDLAKFKLDIPETDVVDDEISLVFDLDQVEEPKNTDFLLNQKPPPPTSSQATVPPAKVLPPATNRERVPKPEPSSLEDKTVVIRAPAKKTPDRHHPVGQLKDVDGEMISQFAIDEDLPDIDFELEEPPPPPPPPSTATMATHAEHEALRPAPLSAEDLETILRAQSREVIEEVVRRVVPEIATKLIKEELDRLLAQMAAEEKDDEIEDDDKDSEE